jgi:hypothetical protein
MRGSGNGLDIRIISRFYLALGDYGPLRVSAASTSRQLSIPFSARALFVVISVYGLLEGVMQAHRWRMKTEYHFMTRARKAALYRGRSFQHVFAWMSTSLRPALLFALELLLHL